jgi:hypothetical protein
LHLNSYKFWLLKATNYIYRCKVCRADGWGSGYVAVLILNLRHWRWMGGWVNAITEENFWFDMIWYICWTTIGLSPGGSSTVHIYTQTIHRTTQSIWEECGPCLVFASYTLAFALQLRNGKASIRVAKECQLALWRYINIL